MYQPTFEIRIWTDRGWLPILCGGKPLTYNDRAAAYTVRDQLLSQCQDRLITVRRVS